ncbi:MAG: aminopeptidase [Deltaproteobacteria bacterium]|jgi:predicted aminopeptidase|nr:aminopeptidase [Deltaproteobacteria bacterium]
MVRVSLLGLLLLVLAGTSGCYYSHLADGQLRLLWGRRPIEEASVDPALADDERRLLGLVDPVRSYARELGLRVGGQYTSYVEWPGDRVVTTVVRTPPGSLEAQPYRFPLVGALPYKGYFDRDRAEAEAARQRAADFDVCVTGVSAYSTLGWIDDPVTGPMLRRGAASLVETILHELVHATAFLDDESDFNESIAQFIGQEAAIRFFARLAEAETLSNEADWPSEQRMRDRIDDRRAVARVLMDFREELERLAPGQDAASVRSQSESRARARLASLPLRTLRPEEVAQRARLGNACLSLQGTYARALPRHAELLAALGGDLEAFVARLARWSDEGLPAQDFFELAPEAGSASGAAPQDGPAPSARERTGLQRPSSATTPS